MVKGYAVLLPLAMLLEQQIRACSLTGQIDSAAPSSAKVASRTERRWSPSISQPRICCWEQHRGPEHTSDAQLGRIEEELDQRMRHSGRYDDRGWNVTARAAWSLLTADRLLDGSGADGLQDAAVLIEGGTIRAIGRRSEVRPPDGSEATTHAYGDATILPGLVDGHTHLIGIGDGTRGDDVAVQDDDLLLIRAALNARAMLHSGVTTIRENGSKGRIAFSVREAIGARHQRRTAHGRRRPGGDDAPVVTSATSAARPMASRVFDSPSADSSRKVPTSSRSWRRAAARAPRTRTCRPSRRTSSERWSTKPIVTSG